MTQGLVRYLASSMIAASTYFRSAANSPFFWGVPTHRKWTSPNAPASSIEVVNRNRPAATCSLTRSSSPGS